MLSAIATANASRAAQISRDTFARSRILLAITPRRTLGIARKAPTSDPLHLLQQECASRQLCDADGNRIPGVDWRMSIGVADAKVPGAAPNLRTVGIERVTPAGLDFVIKRGTGVAQVLAEGQAMSFLHTQGLFLPGQSAEQWRGEGSCVVLPLSEVLDQVPHFVITSMVGSKRIAAERTGGWPVDEDSAASSSSNSSATDEAEADGASTRVRESVDSRTHLTEVMQQTRIELENGDVTLEELDECMQAFRLQPVRMECMWASPDSSVLWDRWEWQREVAADDSQSSDVHASLLWVDPRNLVPH